MFENITKSEEALAEDQRSPEQNASLRLAGILLIVAGLTGLVSSLLHRGAGFSWALITVVCGLSLYRLDRHSEAFALGLVLLSPVGLSIAFLAALPLRAGILACVPTCASAAAVLLLLVGRQSRSKRILATVLFLPVSVGAEVAIAVWMPEIGKALS
jgi:hypothetical protein